MGHMLLEWFEVLRLDIHFPILQDLYLGSNMISTLQPPPLNAFTNLLSLNLENNEISNWKDIEALGFLPMLNTLSLANNRISGIDQSSEYLRATEEKGCFIYTAFKSLTTLNINKNMLEKWLDIHAFNHFQSLVNIRLSGNPILNGFLYFFNS